MRAELPCVGTILLIMVSIGFSVDTTLWDFGVVIQKVEPAKPSSRSHDNPLKANIKANIADPFVAPIKASTLAFKSSVKNSALPIAFVNESNILQVKSFISKQSLQKNYQQIIYVLQFSQIESLDERDRNYIQYWLSDAFFQTGNLIEAQKHAEMAMQTNATDGIYLLLAKIYESQGDVQKAKQLYEQLITQYPKSDYVQSAKIKTRILNRQ